MPKNQETYSPKDIIEMTGKSMIHIYNLFHSKGFPSYKMGRCLLVDKVDYEAWKNKQKETGVN